MAGLAAARMSGGSELHAAGLACEKACSPNLVRSHGITYLLLEADRRPVLVAALLDVRIMSARYAWHLPVCISYMIVYSLKSIRQQIGSQCSSNRLGVTWLQMSSWWMRCAAVFWTCCCGSSADCRMLVLRYSSLALTWQVQAPCRDFCSYATGYLTEVVAANYIHSFLLQSVKCSTQLQ